MKELTKNICDYNGCKNLADEEVYLILKFDTMTLYFCTECKHKFENLKILVT